MSGVKSGSRKKRGNAGAAPVRKATSRAGTASSSSSTASAAASPAAPTPPQSDPSEDLAALIDSIEEMLEQSDLGSAERALRSRAVLGPIRAGDVGPQHAHLIRPMELLAQVLMEKGKSKEAFTWLRACCQLQPDGGSEKWMYYGQLLGGHAALDAFKRGITCMLKSKATIVDQMAASRARALANVFTMGEHESDAVLAQQLAAIDKQISSGYTSMAELYVTDCCDDDGAERECEKLLSLALAVCPDNPDALYASANLRTIQGRLPEATELVSRCLGVLSACRARSIEQMGVLALGALDQQQEHGELNTAINLYDVSYELRVAVAKLAIELEQYTPASSLLEQLLEEDDRVLEVEHLAAVAQHNRGDYRLALTHCERALELLASEEDAGMAPDGHDEEDGPDEVDEEERARGLEEIAASKRALTQLRAQCAEAAKTQPPDAEEEGEGEEDGEDATAEGDEQKGNGEAAMED